jgi:hypothetical protein
MSAKSEIDTKIITLELLSHEFRNVCAILASEMEKDASSVDEEQWKSLTYILASMEEASDRLLYTGWNSASERNKREQL